MQKIEKFVMQIVTIDIFDDTILDNFFFIWDFREKQLILWRTL